MEKDFMGGCIYRLTVVFVILQSHNIKILLLSLFFMGHLPLHYLPQRRICYTAVANINNFFFISATQA